MHCAPAPASLAPPPSPYLLLTQLRKHIEEKNRLLRQLAAGQAAISSSSSALATVDLSGLAERWDAFVGQLQAYDSHLDAQRQGLQQQLVKRFEDFRGTVVGFASRCVWKLRPVSGPLCCLEAHERQMPQPGGPADPK